MFLPQPNQIVDVFIIIDRAGNYPVGNQLITTVLLLVKPFADSKQQGDGAVENQFFGIAGRVMQFAADEKSQQNDGRVKNKKTEAAVAAEVNDEFLHFPNVGIEYNLNRLGKQRAMENGQMADVEPVNDINENVEDEQNCVPARQQGKREQQSESGNQVIDYPFGQMGFGFHNNRSQNRKGKIEKKQRPVSRGSFERYFDSHDKVAN